MNLTEHFTLEELVRSQAAVRHSFDEQFSPPDAIKENLTALCQFVLEPVRTALEFKHSRVIGIQITSGYRCPRANTAIGGAANSQHTKGQAADIHCNEITVEELYTFIKQSGIVYDQLIQEFGQWVHVSFTATGENRQQNLRAIKVDGVTKYIPDDKPGAVA